jgi:hypothetical protein
MSVFHLTNEIQAVHTTGTTRRTLWLWTVAANIAEPLILAGFGQKGQIVEAKGVATSLDAAHAEMKWAESMMELKLRFLGFLPVAEGG